LKALSNVELKKELVGPSVTRVGAAQRDETRELIEVKNAPKEEILLLNLVLFDEVSLNEVLDSNFIENLTSNGVKELFGIVFEEYRQKGTNFDKLTSLLCTRVYNTGLVTEHLDKGFFQNVDIKKLKSDCLQRVRERFLNEKAKRLVSEIKLQDDPLKLNSS